jgi:hypothetical protein
VVRHVRVKDEDVIQDVLGELGAMGARHFAACSLYGPAGVWLLCGKLRVCFVWIVCGLVVESVATDEDPLS